MASLFWNTVGTPAQSTITDTEFFSFTTDGQPISRAELSREIMKKVFPETMFRQYVGKITDFGAGKSDHILLVKKQTRDDTITWTQGIGEFDPLPNATMSYTRFDIGVDERGVRFPFTERAKLFSNFDIEAEIKEQAANTIKVSIERDLLMNAFVYLDILGICDNTTPGKVNAIIGKSLAPDKAFGTHSQNIIIKQVAYDDTNKTIDGNAIGNLSMESVLNFATILSQNYTPSYRNGGFGNYLVIMNEQARNRLLQDPVFFTAVSRNQDAERLYSGYIGTFYGQDFVLDKSKMIDTYITALRPAVLQGKAICIFLSKDAVKEVIAKPEQILPLDKADSGRYMSYAVHTYRGESPIWFASVDGQGAGGILVGA